MRSTMRCARFGAQPLTDMPFTPDENSSEPSERCDRAITLFKVHWIYLTTVMPGLVPAMTTAPRGNRHLKT